MHVLFNQANKEGQGERAGSSVPGEETAYVNTWRPDRACTIWVAANNSIW